MDVVLELGVAFLAGLITADSHYGQINTQISSEQQKDRQLEAAIEQELARQRGLENQVANASGASPTAERRCRSPAPAGRPGPRGPWA